MATDLGSFGSVPTLELSAQDVVCLADELQVYHAEFAGLFLRKEQQQWALKYLEGLLQPEGGKSVEPRVACAGRQCAQHAAVRG